MNVYVRETLPGIEKLAAVEAVRFDKMVPMADTATEVRYLRRMGLSYSELARSLPVKVSRTTVFYWAMNICKPRNYRNVMYIHDLARMVSHEHQAQSGADVVATA